MKRALEECLKLSYFSKKPILDIGASEGKTYDIFRRMKKKIFYVATELDETLAKELYERKLDVVICTAYNLPFREKSLNVMSLNVVNWEPMDQEKHLKEIIRVSSDVCMISFYEKIYPKAKRKFENELNELNPKFEKLFSKIFNKNCLTKIGQFRDRNGVLGLYRINTIKN
jgi:ubiquinone/menaquinone biosynthesis C-methylase UbiE